MQGWRYLARRLNGDGTETPLHHDLPFSKPLFDRELSGPGSLKARLAPESQVGLKSEDGAPIFVEGQTAIYAEKDGHIRHGYILMDITDDGPELQLDGVGFTGYPKDQPYNAEYSQIGVDPLDVTRHLWSHLQGKQAGNLGLQVDTTTKTPIRLGTKEDKNVQGSGPFTMGWWDTKDIGAKIDTLATDTPFDYVEEHYWEGEVVKHRLRFGYPTIGIRRTDLRFVVGENIDVPPVVEYTGKDYATAIIMLGAGEGRKMWRGIAVENGYPSRLRRVLTLEDKSLTSQAAVDRAAANALALRKPLPDFSTIVVRDHENAPIGSYNLGDQIQVKTTGGWHAGLDLWVRIIAITTDPEKMTDTLSVVRTDKAA